MKTLPGFQDVNMDQQNGGLDEMLTYDRTMAARLGLTAQSWTARFMAHSASRKYR